LFPKRISQFIVAIVLDKINPAIQIQSEVPEIIPIPEVPEIIPIPEVPEIIPIPEVPEIIPIPEVPEIIPILKYSGKSREGSTIAICDDCGIKFNLPFLPKDDRPVYCNECFRHTKSQYQENEFDSFDYRNKASRTDKKYEEKRKGSRSKEKLSKKQESFFSGGSEKFYDTLREKLFETLGGKVCSSCGFRDERALGFRQINDNESFDNIKRGGFASSWGKYISDPELAREELKVLCLNCNETSRPYSPSKKKTENVKKKRKRFPR